MTLFFVRLFYHSDPDAFPKERVPSNQLGSEQEDERPRQRAIEHLRQVRADYSLERRIFF